MYDGKGDLCSLSATLENRSDGIRSVVAAAGYIGTADTVTDTPDILISEPDANGMRTLSAFFSNGVHLKDSPVLSGDDIIGTSDMPVTHINIVFASSAHGDEFKGEKDASLTVKDFELIY